MVWTIKVAGGRDPLPWDEGGFMETLRGNPHYAGKSAGRKKKRK